jgi:DNA-directed RNA polymerase specialized sigma24 family protein
VTVTDEKEISARFEAERGRLRAVAYRLLGSRTEAEDAVQEAWLRLARSDVNTLENLPGCSRAAPRTGVPVAGTDGSGPPREPIENLPGWLTTVVARVCLDLLRSRKSRGEDGPVPAEESPSDASTDQDVLLADAIGTALLVVLETLDPAERLAFILHDTFGVPFDEIAPIVGRSEAAARQLASRARRRVQGASPSSAADRTAHREIVDAFLAASRAGDFAALLTLLDPDVVVRADAAAAAIGGSRELRGADAVIGAFLGRARDARAVVLDGMPGAAWIVAGKARVVVDFTVRDGSIVRIDLLADAETLASVDLELDVSSRS